MHLVAMPTASYVHTENMNSVVFVVLHKSSRNVGPPQPWGEDTLAHGMMDGLMGEDGWAHGMMDGLMG